MQDLSGPLAEAARAIGRRLAEAGRRAWIVGGAPRDLALGRSPGEIDLASAATPAEVEAVFERTVPLGRPFGTVLVKVAGLDVQHTTFRGESGYSDRRRPDEVVFGASLEADSSRRDFTCNALYLDPLDDSLEDPQGGLADLEARRLRCVGDAAERFREDGLRLLRLARFAAALDLDPEPATLAAAAGQADSLRGVSAERVLVEVEAMLERPGTPRALAFLADLGLLERALPRFGKLLPPGSDRGAWWGRRLRTFERLAAPPGLALGLAALLGPHPGEPTEAGVRERALDVAGDLRLPRAARREIAAILDAAAAIASGAAGSRAERLRLLRSTGFDGAARLVAARGGEAESTRAAELSSEKARLGERGLWPEPFLTAADLERAGVPRGPRWSEILSRMETLQLEGEIPSRAAALNWLARFAPSG